MINIELIQEIKELVNKPVPTDTDKTQDNDSRVVAWVDLTSKNPIKWVDKNRR